jgi:hypothetical protein
MSFVKNEVLIENIIKCSADAQNSSAEIDLFLSELFDDEDPMRRSLADIKNNVILKFELLNKVGAEKQVESSLFEQLREKAYVCKLLSQKLKDGRISDFPPLRAQKHAKIAYWSSNQYSKTAFDSFSALFNKCEGIQLDSFTLVCETVEEDDIFGIIPIINSSDGRLMSFYRLMDKYDLKILAVCRVDNPNGEGFTKFALVCKKIFDIKPNAQKNIELVISGSVVNFITLSEIFKARVKEVTSIPSPHNEFDLTNYVTINLPHSELSAAWLYFYIFGGDVDLIGYYVEI